MRYAILGTLLMVGGIAVKTTAARHAPLATRIPTLPRAYLLSRGGWSPTAYDIVSVVAWMLLIVGIVVVAFALAREIRSVPRA